MWHLLFQLTAQHRGTNPPLSKQKCLKSCVLLQVDQAAHAHLEAVLWRDTAFLAGLGVMDYSLLVGLDSQQHRLVIGIIDFIRQVSFACHPAETTYSRYLSPTCQVVRIC